MRLQPGASVRITVHVRVAPGANARGYVAARPVGGGLVDAVRVFIGRIR